MEDNLLTDYYRAQLREKHRVSPWGGSGWLWIPDLVKLMLKTSIKSPTVLDYGAGRRTFKAKMSVIMPHVHVVEYDPGVPGIDKLPQERFDYVVCTDVMEHVEEQFVDATLQRIRYYARQGVVFNIACAPSRSLLPDGTNTHVTVRPPEWWMKRIKPMYKAIEDTRLVSKHLSFLAVV